jgi:proteasome accessory factor B
VIPEGKIYNVKLKFTPKVATNVTEVYWHSTQKVTHNSDGSAIMEFRVDGINEIFWWILGYGDQVQVLSPKVLREKIIKAATNIVEMNNKL